MISFSYPRHRVYLNSGGVISNNCLYSYIESSHCTNLKQKHIKINWCCDSVGRQLIGYTVLLKRIRKIFIQRKRIRKRSTCRCIEMKAAAWRVRTRIGPMRGLGCNVVWSSFIGGKLLQYPRGSLQYLFCRMNRRYVFCSAPAAGSSGGTFIPPVELAAGWHFCKKKSAYIFDKSEIK